MMTCLPRAFRSAFPWFPVVIAALVIPACVVPVGDDSDEPADVTTQPLDSTVDSTVDGGQDDAADPDVTCNTPECRKLGGG